MRIKKRGVDVCVYRLKNNERTLRDWKAIIMCHNDAMRHLSSQARALFFN